MKILVLDSKGMVGHVMTMYFQEHGHEVIGFEDICNFSALEEVISKNGFDAIINCSAVINQDADNDHVTAVKVNSLLPHFLSEKTAGTKTVIVHRSTDCIYSGRKGHYTLDDWPDANSFYARSKALGEIVNEKDITIRTSLIGPETDVAGTGLFNWFYRQKEAKGYANAIWTGVTTIEFAREVEWLLKEKKHGLLQLVPNYSISKYELLLLFEKYYPANRKIDRFENSLVDKSLVQICDGLVIPDYETMIADMREWTDKHQSIYKYNYR